MPDRYLRILISLALIMLFLTNVGVAARRSSLAGNLLIKDRDDVFFMPQTIRDYQRMVTFDFGGSMRNGNGGMVFGNEKFTLGAFAHKTDFFGAIPNAFYKAGDVAIMNPSGSNDFRDTLVNPFLTPMNWTTTRRASNPAG